MGYARLLRQRSCRDAPSRSPRETGCVVRARLLPEPGLYAEPRQLPHRAVSAHDAMPPERPVDPRRRTPDIAVARRCRLCLRAFGQAAPVTVPRSEEHTSELQSLMRISYAVFCLKKKKITKHDNIPIISSN